MATSRPKTSCALPHLRIIRAFRLGDAPDVRAMIDYLAEAATLGRSPDAVLVDACVAGPGRRDGHDDRRRTSCASIPPHPRLILAGGLTPENVAERLGLVRPWMVDVASGVESSPGRKDPEKVRRFIHAVRSARADEPDPG